MDSTGYSQLVKRLLSEYDQLVNPQKATNRFLVFDDQDHHYLYMIAEWHDQKRLYGVTVHIDIINGKIWIQRDGTEDGIVGELVDAGVPKDQIVLGYRSPFVRQHTEFAVS